VYIEIPVEDNYELLAGDHIAPEYNAKIIESCLHCIKQSLNIHRVLQ
jgi:hypothetical protein